MDVYNRMRRIFRVFQSILTIKMQYLSAEHPKIVCIDSTIVCTYLYYPIKIKYNYVFATRARTMLR